jgi:hypothetical protein
MGVLACDRRGCENIMCDRISYKYGYICEECFEELVNKGVRTSVAEFMASDKRNNGDNLPQVTRMYFEEVFPLRTNL